tara:strand:+ start:3892 stop:4038 length:147 start_codon:yes stop_codon:yes gene_type:complete
MRGMLFAYGNNIKVDNCLAVGHIASKVSGMNVIPVLNTDLVKVQNVID